MKVEIIVDPSRTARAPTGPAASLTQRLAPAAAAASPYVSISSLAFTNKLTKTDDSSLVSVGLLPLL